jgi:hypothetical protein
MQTLFASLTFVVAATLAASAFAADDRPGIVGEYVEARTAEVFAGGCVMNSEAETAGRQAILAWRITRGAHRGVTLDGLSVAAAVAGDRNLGMREMGGEEPHVIRSIIVVDSRGTAAQRDALAALAREMAGGLLTDVVRVESATVDFSSDAATIQVAAADAINLRVHKEMAHDPSCGAMQWFKPFSRRLTASAMGTAETHAFSGNALGTRWSAPHKRSAFWGTFSF